jgi:hypothetical protein
VIYGLDLGEKGAITMNNNHNKFSKDGEQQAVGIPLMAPQQKSQPLDN